MHDRSVATEGRARHPSRLRQAFALALGLAMAPAASAQPGPALAFGGRLDGGLQLIDDGRAAARRVDSGLYTASRIHLRGSEPLGPGLEAVFFMEHRFAADTGAQAGAARFWPGP